MTFKRHQANIQELGNILRTKNRTDIFYNQILLINVVKLINEPPAPVVTNTPPPRRLLNTCWRICNGSPMSLKGRECTWKCF